MQMRPWKEQRANNLKILHKLWPQENMGNEGAVLCMSKVADIFVYRKVAKKRESSQGQGPKIPLSTLRKIAKQHAGTADTAEQLLETACGTKSQPGSTNAEAAAGQLGVWTQLPSEASATVELKASEELERAAVRIWQADQQLKVLQQSQRRDVRQAQQEAQQMRAHLLDSPGDHEWEKECSVSGQGRFQVGRVNKTKVPPLSFGEAVQLLSQALAKEDADLDTVFDQYTRVHGEPQSTIHHKRLECPAAE